MAVPPSNSQRILFLTRSDAFGGTDKHLIQLIQRMTSPEATAEVLCLHSDFLSPRLQDCQYVRVLPVEREPRSLLGWYSLFRRLKPRIVVFIHGELRAFPWYAYLAVHLVGNRQIHAIQHLVAAPLPPPPPGLLRRLAGWRSRSLLAAWLKTRLCRSTICVSDAVRNSLVNEYGYKPGTTVTIHNGVQGMRQPCSLARRKEIRLAMGLRPDAFVLVCAARLAPEKGIDVLLDAISQLKSKGKVCQCLIVGDGPLRDQLSRQATDAGLNGIVHFAGFSNEVARYLAAADVFVLSSRIEGLPLAILEAMSAGLPCVVTDAGGNAEAITNGEQGFVVPIDAANPLARAIEALFSEPLRRRMAENCRLRVRQSFDLDLQMEKIARHLLSVDTPPASAASDRLSEGAGNCCQTIRQ